MSKKRKKNSASSLFLLASLVVAASVVAAGVIATAQLAQLNQDTRSDASIATSQQLQPVTQLSKDDLYHYSLSKNAIQEAEEFGWQNDGVVFYAINPFTMMQPVNTQEVVRFAVDSEVYRFAVGSDEISSFAAQEELTQIGPAFRVFSEQNRPVQTSPIYRVTTSTGGHQFTTEQQPEAEIAFYSYINDPALTESSNSQLRDIIRLKRDGTFLYLPAGSIELQRATESFGYQQESIAFPAFLEDQGELTVPVYRFYFPDQDTFIFVLNEQVKENFESELGQNAQVSFFAYSYQVDGSTPVYRLVSENNKYLYTASSDELESAQAAGYRNPEVAFYVPANYK